MQVQQMYNPSYLILSRHNIYYFRYPLVKIQNKINYIYISLETREPRKALLLARGLEYYTSGISRMYGGIAMNDHEAKKLVSDYLKAKLEEQKQCIDNKPYYTDTTHEWSKAISDIKSNPVPYTAEFISELGLDIKDGSEDFQTLHRYVKRNLPDYYEELRQYNEQAFKVGLKPKQIKEVTAIHSLEDIIAKFLEASRTERSWSNGRREEMQYYLEALKEILGDDFNTMALDKKKAGYVVDIIYQLPVNKEKNAQTRGLGVVEATKVKGINRISAGTIKKYLGAYSTLFEWCENRGYAESNPFKNLKANIVKGKPEVRYAYSDDDINKILAEIQNYPNGLIKKEYEYWGSLIGIYTGARLNEIAQLELDDIKQVDDTWYFDINDSGDKSLKTEASKRKVPVHNKLIEYGLIEHVDKLKRAGKSRILHELTWSKNTYGRNLGRFFNDRLLPALEIKDKNVCFHCLRHTVNTRLLQADVEVSKVQAIIGHTGKKSMTDRYAQEGFKLIQLKEARVRNVSDRPIKNIIDLITFKSKTFLFVTKVS